MDAGSQNRIELAAPAPPCENRAQVDRKTDRMEGIIEKSPCAEARFHLQTMCARSRNPKDSSFPGVQELVLEQWKSPSIRKKLIKSDFSWHHHGIRGPLGLIIYSPEYAIRRFFSVSGNQDPRYQPESVRYASVSRISICGIGGCLRAGVRRMG